MLFHLPRGATVAVGQTGREASRIQYLGATRLRPVSEERQHSALQISHFHVLSLGIRQTALPRLQAGHNGVARGGETFLKSLVISEDEHFVFDDGAAKRSAILIAFEWRGIRFSITIPVDNVEVIPGVQGAVAQILEDGTV